MSSGNSSKTSRNVNQKKRPKEEPPQDQLLSSIPWYPEVQWETTPILTGNDRTNCILSVTSKVPPARLDTTERDPALCRLLTPCLEQADVLRLVGTELHDHQSTMRGLKDLRLAQYKQGCTSTNVDETYEKQIIGRCLVPRR